MSERELTPREIINSRLHDCICENGTTQEVQSLLMEGAEVDSISSNGESPLGMAVRMSRLDLARLLCRHGADPNYRNWDDEFALQGAIRSCNTELVRLLIDHGAKLGGIGIFSALRASEEVLELVVAAGEDVNCRAADGTTPAHMCVVWSSEGMLAKLIELGADITLTNDNLETPLHCSGPLRQYDVVKLLLKNGAPIDVQNAKGQTPLHRATKMLIWRKELMDKVPSENLNDSNRYLFVDPIEDGKKVVSLFVEHGASVAIKDNEGRTSMDIAREAGDAELIEALS